MKYSYAQKLIVYYSTGYTLIQSIVDIVYPTVFVSAHMTIIGLAMGPIQHWIYKYMDIFLPQRTHSSIFKKIMFDQFVVSPGCIYIFIYGIGLLETRGFEVGHKEIKEKFFTIYLVSWYE